MNNTKDTPTTIIKQQEESNSVKFKDFELPEYLKYPIDDSSVISKNLQDYLSLRCNLDSNKLSKTDNATIETAISWINDLRRVVEYQEMWWDEPLVNISNEGEIVFEWWNKKRKITVYLFHENIEYIKVSGKNIDEDMNEGTIKSFEDIYRLWKWISLN